MKTKVGCAIAAVTLVASAACTSSEPTEEDVEQEWERLVGHAWELESGTETYLCRYVTLDRDVMIGAVRPVSLDGTHHVILGLAPSYEGPDETVECGGATTGDTIIFGSGLGAEDLALPEGTAIRLVKGTRLLLNLHLVNATGSALSGTSAVDFIAGEPQDEQHLLEAQFAGPIDFSVPPGDGLVHEGDCTFEKPGTIIAVAPHMHALGTHLRASVLRADGTETVIHDAAFDEDDQSYAVLDEPVSLGEGDRVHVTCAWENPTAEAVSFGTAAKDEMCFALLLRYPPVGADPICFE